jgi:hypothetical protein
MPKYSVTIAANLRAYATIIVKATDPEAAQARANDITNSLNMWREPEMEDAVFDPAWDALDDFEALEDVN